MLTFLMLATAFAVEDVENIPVPMPRPDKDEPNDDIRSGTGIAPVEAEAERPAEIEPEDVIAPKPRPERPLENSADDMGDPADDRAHKENTKPTNDPELADEPGLADETQRVDEANAEPSLMPPPRPAKMPAEELACRARLIELGVTFEELPQLADESGCSAPWPI